MKIYKVRKTAFGFIASEVYLDEYEAVNIKYIVNEEDDFVIYTSNLADLAKTFNIKIIIVEA